MPQWSFSLFFLNSLPPWKSDAQVIKEEFEQILLADQLGFDRAWTAEHNARPYGIISSNQVYLAAVAKATKRIRLGPAVTRVPLHHPVRLAEELAMLDHLSDGRLDWGMGKGYDAFEFQTYGVDMLKEREGRFRESLEIIFRLWTDGEIEYDGEYYRVPRMKLYPGTLQKPYPPVYMAVTKSDESMRWAAEKGYKVILGQRPDWADAANKVKMYRDTAVAAGHSPAFVEELMRDMTQLKHIHVAETDEQAAREYEKSLMWYFQIRDNRTMFGFAQNLQDYEYYLKHRSVILGSPETVIQQLKEFYDTTTISNIICWFNCGGQPHEQVLRSMKLFHDKVMPALL